MGLILGLVLLVGVVGAAGFFLFGLGAAVTAVTLSGMRVSTCCQEW